MELAKRKATRLKEHDYSQNGYYFVTICAKDKQKFFGEIVGDGVYDIPQMKLSAIGEIVKTELLNVEKHYDNVRIDKFVIMPNHIHIVIQITERINPFPTKKYDLSNVVGKYKAAVSRSVGNAFMHSAKIWQTSFHDHIIRNEADYQRIWNYIHTNPAKWQEDCFFVAE